jgi:hypothetical protein
LTNIGEVQPYKVFFISFNPILRHLNLLLVKLPPTPDLIDESALMATLLWRHFTDRPGDHNAK